LTQHFGKEPRRISVVSTGPGRNTHRLPEFHLVQIPAEPGRDINRQEEESGPSADKKFEGHRRPLRLGDRESEQPGG
jgi:hypothetical protein